MNRLMLVCMFLTIIGILSLMFLNSATKSDVKSDIYSSLIKIEENKRK